MQLCLDEKTAWLFISVTQLRPTKVPQDHTRINYDLLELLLEYIEAVSKNII